MRYTFVTHRIQKPPLSAKVLYMQLHLPGKTLFIGYTILGLLFRSLWKVVVYYD